jgi:chromosome partitioning protein
MRTLVFTSFKGGTAKTSASLNIGASLSKHYSKKILLVDFDSQANLSIGMGIGPDNPKTMVPVLKGEMAIRDVIHSTPISNLSIIPANAYLDGIERSPQLGNDHYAHERLRRVLKQIEDDYDFVFIDTPPSLGWLTQSAFFASNYSVICAMPEAFSVMALQRLKEFHESIREYHDINVLGLILSFWDERGAVNRGFLQEINRTFPDKIFQSKIRRDIAVSRSILEGLPVVETDPNSRGAQDYLELSKEFASRFDLCGVKEKLKGMTKGESKVVG